jgi:hypothetical protein
MPSVSSRERGTPDVFAGLCRATKTSGCRAHMNRRLVVCGDAQSTRDPHFNFVATLSGTSPPMNSKATARRGQT